MDALITFLGGSSILAVLLIQWLKKYIKEVISPRWGDLGIHLFLLVISISCAFLGYAAQWIPGNIAVVIGTVFVVATAIYQVLVKSIYQKVIRNRLLKAE